MSPNLEVLRLNTASKSNPDLVMQALAAICPNLRVLSVLGNVITNVGLKAIADGLTQLQELNLKGCSFLTAEGQLK